MSRGGKTLPLLTLLLLGAASTRPFHLTMASNAAATFPLLRRFGTITVDLYPAGFRVKTIWLRGFSRNPKTLTVENPLTRTYVTMPMREVGDMVRTFGGRPLSSGPPREIKVTNGTVRGLAARRFHLIYGPNDSIDVWTTSALGPTPAFRVFLEEFVRALSPPSAAVLHRIPGTPVYVELNVESHRKLPVLRPTSLVFSRAGEDEALGVSPFMFPAPFGTIFK